MQITGYFQKVQMNSVIIFALKTPNFPQIFTSGVIYKFQCGLCNESNYGECVRHLVISSGEHTGISPLTNLDRIVPPIVKL